MLQWVLAQDVTPTGWLNVIIQMGSFGLLAYISVHLAPRLLKDARDERKSSEKFHKDERESRDSKFEAVIHELQAKFEERNDKLVNAVGIQTDKLVTEMERGTDIVTQLLVNACNYPTDHKAPLRPLPRKHEDGK